MLPSPSVSCTLPSFMFEVTSYSSNNDEESIGNVCGCPKNHSFNVINTRIYTVYNRIYTEQTVYTVWVYGFS